MSSGQGVRLAGIWLGILAGLATPVGKASALAAESILSFEERDRYEGRNTPNAWSLQIWVDGKKTHEINLGATGPRWNERVALDVADPTRVQLGFRLTSKASSSEDPEVEIGNIRVRDAKGGEVALTGTWSPVRTDPWFLLQRWSQAPLPAFRDGLSLRRAAGIATGAGDSYAEWRFEGRLDPVANLQIRRLFEYAGCYQELGFYDDWQNIRLSPGRPAPGERTTITARLRNAGSLDVENARVVLLIDGQPHQSREVNVPAVSEVEARFEWPAVAGFHSILLRVEPPLGTLETRLDDNWLLRTLIVGDTRSAHPFLYFRGAEVPSLSTRIAGNPAGLRVARAIAGRERPESPRGYEQTRAMAASNDAFLSLFNPEGPDAVSSSRDRAVAFLRTVWNFPRGHFSDAPCSLVHYAQAYDWVASRLTPDEDREIRSRLAIALDERVRELWSDDDDRFRKGDRKTRQQSFYPARHRGYHQGTYIDACAIVVGALALTGEEGAEAWLHFGLNAIDEEILREMTTRDGYYREGHAYTQMAENRSGAACWLALAHIGASPFTLYPGVGKLHSLFLRDRMPNGWSPPLNDSRGDEPLVQKLYTSLYPDPETAAAARWDSIGREREGRGHAGASQYGNLFLLADAAAPGVREGSAPSWTPTQFLGDHLVFRSDWSPHAAYFCLNTKHNPTTSASHDQVDKGSFLFYAKKAYLAVDPGYGNTAGRALIGTVLEWCRGSRNLYNHNAIVVDGQRPWATHRSPYVYPDSPVPENTFTSSFVDFGESALNEWSYLDPSRGREPCVVNHRRSVLLIHPSSRPLDHYAVVVDTLDSVTDNTHVFESVLNGNVRRPEDLRTNPRDEGAVPRATNLTVAPSGGGLEARWVVENADRQDVALRAFFAAPAPERLNVTTGDGWVAYLSPVGRNKYLSARVDGARHIQFLTVLYPDLLSDKTDDVTIVRTPRGAELTFADGRVHSIAIRNPADPEAPARDARMDGEIVFTQRNASGTVDLLFLARGQSARWNHQAVNATGRLETLALDLRDPGQIRGHLSATNPVDLELQLDRPLQHASFQELKARLSDDAAPPRILGLRGSGVLIVRSSGRAGD